MPQTLGVTISATNAFTASATVNTDIERYGFITQIPIMLEAQYDNSGSPTVYSDAFARVLDNVRVQGGGRIFADIPAIDLHFMNRMDMGSGYKFPDVIKTTTNNLTNDVPFMLNFNNDPSRIYAPIDGKGGPVIGIPANKLTTLQANIGWGSTAAMAGSVCVVDTATLARLAPRRISDYEAPVGNRYYPAISTETYTIAATQTNFGKTFNAPVGKIVKRALVFVFDNTAPMIRDNTRVTRIALITPKDGNAHRFELTWEEFQQLTNDEYPGSFDTSYDLISVNDAIGGLYFDGVGCFDFRKLAMAPGLPIINGLGADLRGLAEGDLKIGVNIGTGNGTIHVVWDCLEAY